MSRTREFHVTAINQANTLISMVETSQTQAFVREREHLLHLRDALDHGDDIFNIVDRCDSVHQATSQMMSLLQVDETTATAVLLLRVKDFSRDHKRHLDERISELSKSIDQQA